MANEVTILVRARDLASSTFLGFDRVTGRVFSAFGRRITDTMKAIGPMVLKVASIGQAAMSIAPAVVAGAKAVYSVGTAAVQAAPMIAAFAVAGIVLKTAFAGIFAEGNKLREVLKPIGEGITLAGKNASEAAAKGLEPLVKSFNKQFWPEINHTFVQIGETVNWVGEQFLSWASSASGLESINGILHPIWQSLDDLAEPMEHLLVSFAQMLGRIMGVSLAAGSNGLAGIMGKLADAMDKVNADTVSGGLSKLKETASNVKEAISTVVEWIGKLVNAYKVYQQEFWMVADAIAIVAIAVGGPVTAIAAAVGLVIRHWDELKIAYQAVVDYFTKDTGGIAFVEALKTTYETILPKAKEAFADLKAKVEPILTDIVNKIKNDLVPAITGFINAMQPVIAFVTGVLFPVIVNTFTNIMNVIRGALDIIIGIFKVFTGILTGDWSKLWEGIKQILSGAGQVLGAIANQIVNLIKGAFDLLGGLISGAINVARDMAKTAMIGVKDAIVGVFSGIWNWATGIGKDIVNGIVSGISSIGSSIKNKLSSLIPSPGSLVKSFIPGMANGGIVGGLAKAATGGARGGLIEVGERGRELVRLPYGSSVIPNGQAEAMLSGGGGAQSRAILELHAGKGKLDRLLLEILREAIRVRGGVVQTVLGT